MPLHRYSAEEAAFGRGPRAQWGRPGVTAELPAEEPAVQRLRALFFHPRIDPVAAEGPVFAAGSCFARALETHLAEHGVEVLSRDQEIAAWPVRRPHYNPGSWLNLYHLPALYTALSWALDPERDLPEDSLVPVEGGVVDLCFNSLLDVPDRVSAQRLRALTRARLARIREAGLFVLTLGLVEAWFDRHTGQHVNAWPPAELLRACPDRFELQILDLDEQRAGLEALHALLVGACRPGLRIAVTVSPIPLARTGTDQDVIVANQQGKATLRALAGEWAQRHPEISYFPSYEAVMGSNRSVAWQADGRHVTTRMARQVVARFVETYLSS